MIFQKKAHVFNTCLQFLSFHNDLKFKQQMLCFIKVEHVGLRIEKSCSLVGKPKLTVLTVYFIYTFAQSIVEHKK